MRKEAWSCTWKMATLQDGRWVNSLIENKRKKEFFIRDAQVVAQDLLGDYLVKKERDGSLLVGKIVETEAYLGKKDDASHAYKGKVTDRNKILFKEGGTIYVYIVYGKYWCFNIVSGNKDGSSVFIRALEPISGIEIMQKRRNTKDIRKLTNGPCRWTISFGIDRSWLGRNVLGDDLFISYSKEKDFEVVNCKRIGIDYAQEGKDYLLRYYIKGNRYVSKF